MQPTTQIQNKIAEKKRDTEAYYQAQASAGQIDDATLAAIAALEEKDKAEHAARLKQRQAQEDKELAEFLAKNPQYLQTQPKKPESPKKTDPQPKQPSKLDQDIEAALKASQLEEENRRKLEADFAKRFELARQASLQAQQKNSVQVSLSATPVQHGMETKMNADEAMAEAMQAEENLQANTISSQRAELLTHQLLATEAYLEQEQRQQQEVASANLAAAFSEEQNQGTDLTGQELTQFYADKKTRLDKIAADKLKNMQHLVGSLLSLKALTGDYQPGKDTKVAMDAHSYTKSDIKKYMPQLITIEDSLKLSDISKSLDTVEAEIVKFVKDKNDAKTAAEMEKNLHESFRRIRAVSTNPKFIDAETGVCVPELLSRMWTLTSKLGKTRQAKMAAIINDNVIANDSSKKLGGCVPGLVARLFPEYVKALAVYLNVLPLIETPEMIMLAAFNPEAIKNTPKHS